MVQEVTSILCRDVFGKHDFKAYVAIGLVRIGG